MKHAKPIIKQQLTNSIRVSIRISGGVTSLSIRKNLIALWILLSEVYSKDPKEELTEFIYKCLDLWKGDTAKGFSDFVSEKLIQSILETEDYIAYKKILKTL